jgi:hypothetical protein
VVRRQRCFGETYCLQPHGQRVSQAQTAAYFCRFLASGILCTWRWRQHAAPKRRSVYEQHSVTIQKTVLFIVIAVRTRRATMTYFCDNWLLCVCVWFWFGLKDEAHRPCWRLSAILCCPKMATSCFQMKGNRPKWSFYRLSIEGPSTGTSWPKFWQKFIFKPFHIFRNRAKEDRRRSSD